MVEIVVESTNERIEDTIDDLGEDLAGNDTEPFTCTIDAQEIYALFGLFYFRGLLGLSLNVVLRLFSEKYRQPVFGSTMSRNRFSFLSALLCFDDTSTQRE